VKVRDLLLWITSKQVAIYAPCPPDLCYSIGLRPPFLALRASTRPAAWISACGLNFRSFEHQLESGCSAALGAPVNRRAQLCCGLRGVAAKF